MVVLWRASQRALIVTDVLHLHLTDFRNSGLRCVMNGRYLMLDFQSMNSGLFCLSYFRFMMHVECLGDSCVLQSDSDGFRTRQPSTWVLSRYSACGPRSDSTGLVLSVGRRPRNGAEEQGEVLRKS